MGAKARLSKPKAVGGRDVINRWTNAKKLREAGVDLRDHWLGALSCTYWSEDGSNDCRCCAKKWYYYAVLLSTCFLSNSWRCCAKKRYYYAVLLSTCFLSDVLCSVTHAHTHTQPMCAASL